MVAHSGRTVHVVPAEGGQWSVVDLQRRGQVFPSKSAALDHAKRIAAAQQPSQVVLFDAFGHFEPIAHYQLPDYQLPHLTGENGSALFEATVKALLIAGFAAAGIAVLGELVDRVERELKRESARSRHSTKPGRRSKA
ncbi:MAG: DUF2188 domain-containing protein [Bryobacteraceae bacterium]